MSEYSRRITLLSLIALAICRGPAIANDIELTPGVPAFRGEQAALQRCLATTDYLSRSLDGFSCRLLPLTLDGMRESFFA